MDTTFELRQRLSENFTSKDDDRGCTVTDFLVLGSAEFDHGLGSGMCDFDFTEDSVSIVGEEDTAHGVEDHFEHGFGTKTGSNDIGDGFCGGDIGDLSFATGLALRAGVHDEHGLLRHVGNMMWESKDATIVSRCCDAADVLVDCA